VGLAMAGIVVWTFVTPDTAGLVSPSLGRIIFWHLQPAFLATAFFIAGAWFGLVYLRRRERHFDMRSAAANEIGLLMAVYVMVSGIIFARVQWGEYWSWDPRQTSYLMVLLMYFSYFILRSTFKDPEKRASNAAGYALAGLIPVLFLTFVFPRLGLNKGLSMHPDDALPATVAGRQTPAESRIETIVGDPERPTAVRLRESAGFDAQHTIGLLGSGLVLLTISLWAYRIRTRAGLLELEAEEIDERLDDSGHRAGARMVRPVSLHDEGGRADQEG
jgi:heme exporter protein C